MKKISYGLNLDTNTNIYVYFKMKAGYTGNISAVLDSEAVAAEKLSNDTYRVAIYGIPAARLNEVHNITMVTDSGEAKVAVSAMSYIYSGLSSNANEVTRNAMAAYYNYYKAFAEYQKNQ